MGQSVKFIVTVKDVKGQPVDGAQITLTLHDAGGKVVATVPAEMGRDKVYRTEAVTIPHRTVEGAWQTIVDAKTATAQGRGSGSFKVKNSTSEDLLYKYGFWLNAPTLRGIVPQLVAEKGDAHNGMIRWGGVLPSQHILPESWVDIDWREGDYGLKDNATVRRFLLEEVGDLGFSPVREIDPFQPTRFKQWEAWQAKARGQVGVTQVEMLVFYAPEVDRTYAIVTNVVQPLVGSDPHVALRNSFDISPELHAAGTAPEPLPRLLPAPELLSPALGAMFEGIAKPIVLVWKPMHELAPDEYYEVDVDYNYGEANPLVRFATRETQLTLPETLYRSPNCGVFNWKVVLKRQTGVDEDGKPQGEPLSYNSLYWYIRWDYPLGTTPFLMLCPNQQF